MKDAILIMRDAQPNKWKHYGKYIIKMIMKNKKEQKVSGGLKTSYLVQMHQGMMTKLFIEDIF